MKKKTENKGFTLVELIVVLVILAILAAILVPALLGYIDNAKAKQTVLNAKSCLTAAQAEMSNLYAIKNSKPVDITSDNHVKAIKSMADTESLGTTELQIATATIPTTGATTKQIHDGYTVKWVHYKDASGELWFDGSSWVDQKAAVPSGCTQYVIMGTAQSDS